MRVMAPSKEKEDRRMAAVKAAATGAPERIVATLHTSAADRLPTPPRSRRVERVREISRRDPVRKQDK